MRIAKRNNEKTVREGSEKTVGAKGGRSPPPKKKFKYFFLQKYFNIKVLKIYMDDLECAEIMKNQFFRFLFFELWSFYG